MTFFRIIGFALLGLAVILILRGVKSELAAPASALLHLTLIGAAVGILAPVLDYLRQISEIAGTGNMLTVLFKACGIAVISGFAASLCRDCGETAMAGGVDLCGRCVILTLALPLIKSVFETVFAVLPS